MKKPKLPGRNIKVRDIAPGVWEDADGNAHVDCEALCEMHGVEPTKANIKWCMDTLAEQCKKDGLPFILRQNKPDIDE